MFFRKATDFLSKYFNPLNYSEKEEYYQNRLYPPNSFIISTLFEDSENAFLTPIRIHYEKNKWNHSEISLIKNLGEPDYIINQECGEYQYNVLFNKENMEGYKVLRQTHFIDNTFFYACNTYKTLRSEDRLRLRDSILKEYQCIENSKNSNSIKLFDTDNNKIAIMDDVYLRVCYLSGNDEIKNILVNFSTKI